MTAPPRDELGQAVDALMDAVRVGDVEGMRRVLGDLLAIVFGRLTSTIGATLTPLSTRLDRHGAQLDAIREALRTIELRMDWQQARVEHLHNELRAVMEAQSDAATERLDRKRAELNAIQGRLDALERGRDGT